MLCHRRRRRQSHQQQQPSPSNSANKPKPTPCSSTPYNDPCRLLRPSEAKTTSQVPRHLPAARPPSPGASRRRRALATMPLFPPPAASGERAACSRSQHFYYPTRRPAPPFNCYNPGAGHYSRTGIKVRPPSVCLCVCALASVKFLSLFSLSLMYVYIVPIKYFILLVSIKTHPTPRT